MRFEKFMTKNKIDEELLFKQAKGLDDVVLGENTWLYMKHPILEEYYFDVTDGLNEDEVHHFAMANKMLLEKKLEATKDDDEIKRLEKEIKKIEKENAADDTWFANDDGIGFRNKNWEKQLDKEKGRKPQSWRGQKRKDKPEYKIKRDGKEITVKNKPAKSSFGEFIKGVEAEDKEIKKISKDYAGDWDKDVEEVYNDISITSRKAFHKLDDLGKKSFIVKYILHGLEAKKDEGWGRLASTAKDKDKEIVSDRIKSYETQKKFVKDVMKMYKEEQKLKKEGAAKKVQLLRKYKDEVGLEMALAKSNDKTTTALLDKAKEFLAKGAFKDDGGAGYLEMLFKIASKEYKDIKEITSCMKQYAAFAPNKKTSLNIDITTICPKRAELKRMEVEYAKAAQAYIDGAKAGTKGALLAKLKKDMDNKKVTVANNPTCSYCYVELGREGGATFLAKAEKSGQAYGGEIENWISKKKGNPQKDNDGNYILKKTGKDTRDALNKMGGLRFFGSSDYVEDKWTDTQIKKIIADATKVGLQLKAVTKQKRFVEKYGGVTFESGPLEGKPVFNINMSVDEAKGFKLEDAIRLKKKYPQNNVNIRVVALNPDEAVKYSKRPEVDVITLLHFKERGERLRNQKLYVNMSPGSKGWKVAIEQMKKAHPRANWNKVLSKLCCSTKGNCKECPNACGFNPNRVVDFVQKARGGKLKLKTSDMDI